MRAPRIVLVGPCNGVPTGQSIVTWHAASVLRANAHVHLIDTNFAGLRLLARMLGNLSAIARIVAARMRGGRLYISASRSAGGALKDLVALALWQLPVGARGTMLHLHGSDFAMYLDSLPRLLKFVAVRLYRRVSLWIIITPGMRDQFVHFQPRRIVVIENPLPPEAFSTVQRTVHDGPLRLLFLSNLIRSKGVLEVATAVRDMAGSGADRCELRIAGAPIDPSVLSELAALAEHCSSIRYIGPVYGQLKCESLMWADAVVLPSSYPSEAVPLCLLEGAASGCYLVASSAGYIADIADYLCVSLLPDTSAETIKKTLESLDKTQVVRLGNKNRLLAQNRYRMRDFDEKLTAAAESLL